MANQYYDPKTLQHFLFDVHGLEGLFRYKRFKDYDTDSINILLDAVKSYCDKEAYPYLTEMDEQPAHYKNGTIIVHPAVEKIMKAGDELGLIGGVFDNKDGGLQMPKSVFQAAYFIIDAANNSLSGYPGLTSGSAKLIASYGSDFLKQTYIPKMLSGEWSGTMCLTEPQAGSSLSDILTLATPQPDGSFKIVGQKIFISGGDHQYSNNFVHLVLGRIKNAPAGTKGISLFVVPKNRPTKDGGLEYNDVITVADFQKLGQRGYCTTHLSFGDGNDCYGWLVGEAHKGLSYMFKMMNGARISVGRHGASISSAAYYASLQYANERSQGRKLTNGGKKDLSQNQTLIINHPDVRRMLLLQKAISEGSLSLILQAAKYSDLEDVTEGEESEKYNILLEMLTPVVKTYPSEKGKQSVDTGLQVLGGYGFCSDFVLQQYYRDIRIMSIYEGTTGIQSLDLLGRKMTFKNGDGIKYLSKEIMITVTQAMAFEDLKPYAQKLVEQLELNKTVLKHLFPHAAKGDYERFLSDATIYMEFFGTIIIAWQWLKIANTSKRLLLDGSGNQVNEFYESKIHTMKFFFKYEVSRNIGIASIMMNNEVLTIIDDKEYII